MCVKLGGILKGSVTPTTTNKVGKGSCFGNLLNETEVALVTHYLASLQIYWQILSCCSILTYTILTDQYFYLSVLPELLTDQVNMSHLESGIRHAHLIRAWWSK